MARESEIRQEKGSRLEGFGFGTGELPCSDVAEQQRQKCFFVNVGPNCEEGPNRLGERKSACVLVQPQMKNRPAELAVWGKEHQ